MLSYSYNKTPFIKADEGSSSFMLHYIVDYYPHLDVPQVLQIRHPS